MNSEFNQVDWYLVTSKPKQEVRAVENLANQGIESFTPLIDMEKIIKGKRQIKSEAMFTGYVFVKISPEDPSWASVRSTRGVRDWVKFAGKPAKIPKNLVSALMTEIDQVKSRPVVHSMKAGEPISILKGPFQGLNGIFQAPDGDMRSMIFIEFLGKQNLLSVANEQISNK